MVCAFGFGEVAVALFSNLPRRFNQPDSTSDDADGIAHIFGQGNVGQDCKMGTSALLRLRGGVQFVGIVLRQRLIRM